jgi:hypothetical protein
MNVGCHSEEEKKDTEETAGRGQFGLGYSKRYIKHMHKVFSMWEATIRCKKNADKMKGTPSYTRFWNRWLVTITWDDFFLSHDFAGCITCLTKYM